MRCRHCCQPHVPETAFGCKAVKTLLNQFVSLDRLLELLKSPFFSDWLFCKAHCLQSHRPFCCIHWPQEGRHALPSQHPQIAKRRPWRIFAGRGGSDVVTVGGFNCGKCEPHTQHWYGVITPYLRRDLKIGKIFLY